MSPAYIFNSPRNQAPFLHFYLLTSRFSESVSWYSSPSFLSLQVTGLGPRRCHAHRRFPATPRSRAKRHSRPCPGPAATASATAPASSNDTQRDAETRETVCPDLPGGHHALCLAEDQLQGTLKWVGSIPAPSGRLKTGVLLP